MARTLSFTGSKGRAFIESPGRARGAGGSPRGGLVLLWSASVFVGQPAWYSLYGLNPVQPGGTQWENPQVDNPPPMFANALFQGSGYSPYVYGGVGGSPFFSAGTIGLPPVPTYATDADPIQFRVWAYHASNIKYDVVCSIPWNWTPQNFMAASSIFFVFIDLSVLVPFTGNLILTANLLQQLFIPYPSPYLGNNPLFNDFWQLIQLTYPDPNNPTNRLPGVPSTVAPWNFTIDGIATPKPTNIYTLPLGSFNFSDSILGWGWQGTLRPTPLDDSTHRDPYLTYPDPTNTSRASELLKPAAEPLGYHIQLDDGEGNILPADDANFHASTLPGYFPFTPGANWYVQGLVNELFTYQYYRIIRNAAAYVSTTNTVDQTGGILPPPPTASPFVNNGQLPFTFYFHPLNGLSGQNGNGLPPSQFSSGAPAGFGAPFGNFNTLGSFVFFSALAPWKTITSLYYNEYITDMLIGFGGQLLNSFFYPNLPPSGVVVTPPGPDSWRSVIWSTLNTRTEIEWNNPQFGIFPFADFGTDPGLVDTISVIFSEDQSPFFISPTNYSVFSCHRRILNCWALNLTEAEVLDASHLVGDQLSSLQTTAASELASCHSFAVSNANPYYIGDYSDPDNLGYWQYGQANQSLILYGFVGSPNAAATSPSKLAQLPINQ